MRFLHSLNFSIQSSSPVWDSLDNFIFFLPDSWDPLELAGEDSTRVCSGWELKVDKRFLVERNIPKYNFRIKMDNLTDFILGKFKGPEIEILEPLNSGSFGLVYKGKSEKWGIVALKVVKKLMPVRGMPDQSHRMMREVETVQILSTRNHPNVQIYFFKCLVS